MRIILYSSKSIKMSPYSNDDSNEAQDEIEENCLRAVKRNKMMEERVRLKGKTKYAFAYR